MEEIMDLLENLKIKLKNEAKEGCIICYSFPGNNNWNKDNALFTNFCQECNIVLCKDCCQKIKDRKCPICHVKSKMFENNMLPRYILTRLPIPYPNSLVPLPNSPVLVPVRTVSQESARLRRKRYRLRKRIRDNSISTLSNV
jgi:hypothetical protein